MKSSDLAFVNRQLASMISSGQPLEAALQQLCSDMPAGRLKSEMSALEDDLATGTAFDEAIDKRDLPRFYRQMMKLGKQSNDMPGVLLLLANYYSRLSTVWDTVKSVTFYPLIVLFAACLVSVALARIIDAIQTQIILPDLFPTGGHEPWISQLNWLPVLVLCSAFVALGAATCVRPLRERLKWIIPVARDTALAQFASSMSMLLKKGCSLGDATRFIRELEGDSVLGRELQIWAQRMESGMLVFSALGERSRIVPPMFVWLIEQEAQDLPKGLDSAANHYTDRAERQFRIWSEAAAPIGLLGLGIMIACQIYPVFWWLQQWFEKMGTL